MKNTPRRLPLLVLVAAIFLVACGGGGGGSSTPTQPQPVTITTASPLPGTLQGHAYSTALTASGGQGAYHWSIAPLSSTALFVDGLTVDPNTGVLSGTANFGGTAGLIATVTDSSIPPQTVTKSFTVTASTPLTVPPTQTVTARQYLFYSMFIVSFSGGVEPLTWSLRPSCLPPGMKSNVSLFPYGTFIVGTPYTVGTFQCTVTIQDSFSPPEAGSQLLTINVLPPPLEDMNSLPVALLLNRPFSGRAIARGGVPPYSFAISSGSLPPGISLEPSTGEVSGTPLTPGSYSYGLTITDSSSPVQTVSSFGRPMSVQQAKGRNDSPATASPISNGSFSASLSPYIDPVNGTPTAGDQDYYVVSSLGGAVVHMETNLNGPLDTVLEIVDGNGHQLSTCRALTDTSTNFNSACLNDDIGSGILRSALEVQVPGTSDASTNLYIHVLDWRGDARPDMGYSLSVSGVATPLQITSATSLFAIVGNGYNRPLSASGGSGRYSWSVASGTLPPGMTLANTGFFELAGALATTGTYTFDVRVDDAGPPAQSATAIITFNVVNPLQITTTSLPQGKVGTAYSATINITGGVSPYSFTVFPVLLPPGLVIDPATGAISGTPTAAGTYTGQVRVTDSSGQTNFQFETIVVNP
jgi:hypothetical protein